MFEGEKPTNLEELQEKPREKRPQRRSSIFLNHGLADVYIQKTKQIPSNTVYPEDYDNKLREELSAWENLVKDLIHEEEKLKTLKVMSVKENVLSQEHENYLSSLPNLHEYIDKATRFLNERTTAEDKLRFEIQNKQGIIRRTIKSLKKS